MEGGRLLHNAAASSNPPARSKSGLPDFGHLLIGEVGFILLSQKVAERHFWNQVIDGVQVSAFGG